MILRSDRLRLSAAGTYTGAMPDHPQLRPRLTPNLTGAELQRWYWLKDELTDFARLLGIQTTGGKETLTARIVASLEGREERDAVVTRSVTAKQLQPPLFADTVIPPGQRCSQVVRAWLEAQLGTEFRFDAHMRDFFAGADGTRTLQDALDHWRRTRGQNEKPIDPQFEYNRFSRAWHLEHPGGSHQGMITAWQHYRSMPVDTRGRI